MKADEINILWKEFRGSPQGKKFKKLHYTALINKTLRGQSELIEKELLDLIKEFKENKKEEEEEYNDGGIGQEEF